MTHKLYIKTYGCQMNVYDSQRMEGLLKNHNYQTTSTPDDADLIILNTCHIREKASEKVFSDLGRLREIKANQAQEGRDIHIAVAGCTAQAEGTEIARRAPYVDMILGPQSYHELPELLERLKRQRAEHGPAFPSARPRIIATEFATIAKFDSLQTHLDHEGPTAFVTIQEGCDKFCHFCVVPYTRGAEASRSGADIIAEVQHLVSQGVMEVTLLGQNVNGYHGAALAGSGEWSLGRLCYELADRVPGLKRLRYTTCHPKDVHPEQISAHRDIPILMPILHLPVQSGSDAVLKAMNRKHTRDWYRDVIHQFRDANPAMAFSSDFIVGYPNETKEDFLDTLKLVQEVDFAQAYSFKYSVRPGTPASFLEDQVPESEKDERLQMLQQLIWAQQQKFNAQCVGQTIDVIIERRGKEKNQYIGRSPYLQSVHVVSSDNILGKMVTVTIVAGGQNSLHGVLHAL